MKTKYPIVLVHGAGIGKVSYDTYRFLSCIGESIGVSRWCYDPAPMPEEGDERFGEYAIRRETAALYQKIVPFLSCDYYPLIRLFL